MGRLGLAEIAGILAISLAGLMPPALCAQPPAEVPPAAESPPPAAPEGQPAPAETPPASPPAEGAPPPPTPAEGAPAAPAAPPAPGRMIDQPEHDRLILYQRAVGADKPREFQVERLDVRGRQMPEPRPRDAEKLTVRMLDNPGEELEVRWGDIEQIDFFEQMILREAQQLVAAGRLDEAFDYYRYLEQDPLYRDYPGVSAAVENFLFEDAKALARTNQYDGAWGVLLEVYDRNPNFTGLARAMGRVTQNLVDARLQQNDFLAARRLLNELARRYPDEAVVTQLKAYFQEQAAARLSEARRQLAAGQLAQAQQLATDAVRIWPQSLEAQAFLAEQTQAYPLVTVAVAQFAGDAAPGWPDDFPRQRADRLLNRRVLELVSYDPLGEGAAYQSSFCELERFDLGQRLVFRVRPGVTWSDGRRTLSGADLAASLTAMTHRGHPRYTADWADLVAGIRVTPPWEVEVALRRGHVRPDAMLSIPLSPWDEPPSAGGGPALGPYLLAESTETERVYRLSERYFAAGPTQPREIRERLVPRSQVALQELAQGAVALVDRLNPWDLADARAIPGVTVAPYGVPTVHCLVPNLAKPFSGDRTFRRAVLYGIARGDILRQRLLKGAELEGAVVLSAPVPLGYATNAKVEPRPFDVRLAITLSNVVAQKVAAAAQKEAEAKSPPGDAQSPPAEGQPPPADGQFPPPPSVPKLILAHPATELARLACQDIQRYLSAAKIPLELKELPPGVSFPPPEEYDFLYAELTLSDPIVDLRRVLEADGPLGKVSPYVSLALRQLDQAADWKSARDQLLRLHELLAEELPLLPLWQLVDHYAYREGLAQVGTRPVSLFQNVERWQVTPWLPPDAN